MTSRHLKKIAQISALLLAGASTAALADDWSPWLAASGDSSIEFRYKMHYYGSGLTPSCELEVHNGLGSVSSVRADITVDQEDGPVELTRTFYLSTYTQIGTDIISSCGDLSDFQVTSAYRR